MKPQKKVVLTKARLARLHTAISIDDILYAKYCRMMEEINHRERRFRRQRQVIGVTAKIRGLDWRLFVVKEIKTPDGIYLEVGGFPPSLAIPSVNKKSSK